MVTSAAALQRVKGARGAFSHGVLTRQSLHSSAMDKSNVAFALITAILGIYISVALVLSRVRASRGYKTRRLQQADDKPVDTHKRRGTWTSYSS
jgi:hypothetical protein